MLRGVPTCDSLLGIAFLFPSVLASRQQRKQTGKTTGNSQELLNRIRHNRIRCSRIDREMTFLKMQTNFQRPSASDGGLPSTTGKD